MIDSARHITWQMSGEVVLMTLVGGMGTVFGPIFGAGIIVAMQNYLSGFGEWVLVIQGAIFVITVLLFRRGIVGEIIALGNRGRTVRTGKREETVVQGEVKAAE
jgi:branched-chain amino acid transport system permease protein